MPYKKMDIISFGKKLLETEDLDPIYVMLWKAKLRKSKLERWLLAYWWFYHAGVASYLSSYKGRDFFSEVIAKAAPESKTPRGTERRHFRGQACLKALIHFERKYSHPEEAVDHVIQRANGDVGNLLSFVKKRWPLFGPWIGFKMADMLERLGFAEIKFPIKTLEMYAEPTKGVELLRSTWHMNKHYSNADVVKQLVYEFRHYKAPPRYERKVGVQEVETILCKWKSHMHGHYPIGKDIREIREGLYGWGDLAKRLERKLPKEVK